MKLLVKLVSMTKKHYLLEMSASSTIFAATVTDDETLYENATISIESFNPCPRKTWELIVGGASGMLIVLSNVVCMIFLNGNKIPKHPENRFYILNLGVSNLFCGLALLGVNTVELITNASNLDRETCYTICLVVGPLYIFSIMSPYVALATLGLDIAYYCHISIDYQRRMSRRKLFISIASGWLYTFSIVFVVSVVHPNVLCDKSHFELSIWFISFPILLMLLPALCVVIIFTYVLHKYWKKSQRIERRLSVGANSGWGESKARLVRRFAQRFSHLIVFSILCGIAYTTLTIVEVLIEANTHKRLCVLYRVDRVFISLNSFLTPWIQSLATKQFRTKIWRRYFARWRNNKMLPMIPAGRRRHQDSRTNNSYATG